MSTKNLSSVATAVIESYGNTAINMINAYRVGGERVIGFVDQRFEAAVNTGAARLSDELRSNLIDTEKRISGYYAKGLQIGTDRAESAVSTAVELANKGVDRIAANAERFDQATKFGALDMLNRVALPAATAMSEVVVRDRRRLEPAGQEGRRQAGDRQGRGEEGQDREEGRRQDGEEGHRHQEGRRAQGHRHRAQDPRRGEQGRRRGLIRPRRLTRAGASRLRQPKALRARKGWAVPSALWRPLSRRCHPP